MSNADQYNVRGWSDWNWTGNPIDAVCPEIMIPANARYTGYDYVERPGSAFANMRYFYDDGTGEHTSGDLGHRYPDETADPPIKFRSLAPGEKLYVVGVNTRVWFGHGGMSDIQFVYSVGKPGNLSRYETNWSRPGWDPYPGVCNLGR